MFMIIFSSVTDVKETEPLTGRKWKIFKDSENWMDANRICESQRGNLAVVDSSSIERFLKDFVDDKNTCGGVYIGNLLKYFQSIVSQLYVVSFI